MANHKRKRPKSARAGCLLCKPHKANAEKNRPESQTMQERRAIENEKTLPDDLLTWREEASYDGTKMDGETAEAFAKSWIAVRNFFDEQYPDGNTALLKTAAWFSESNPMLGDVAPITMVNLNRAHELWHFVLDAIAANSIT